MWARVRCPVRVWIPPNQNTPLLPRLPGEGLPSGVCHSHTATWLSFPMAPDPLSPAGFHGCCGLSAEVKEVPALLQVQRPQVVLKCTPSQVLWEERQVESHRASLLGSGPPVATCQEVPSELVLHCWESGEQGRKQSERPQSPIGWVTWEVGVLRDSPSLRRQLTPTAGTRGQSLLTPLSRAEPGAPSHLFCRGHKWEVTLGEKLPLTQLLTDPPAARSAVPAVEGQDPARRVRTHVILQGH